jgi:Protein of unknown function (DUF1566)
MSQRSSLRSVCLVFMVAVCVALPAQADAPLGQYTASMGMVTDNKTGLTWQQSEGPELTWSDAKEYCTDLDLNGFGWRLPTVKELLTLVVYSKTNPSIDTSVNGFPGTSVYLFWSATPDASAPSNAWTVFFDIGGPFNEDMSFPCRVRCVR